MNWAEYLNKILNNIILLLNPTWPQVVVVLGLIFILLFRKNIAKLFDKDIEIKKDGVTIKNTQSAPPSDPLEEKKKIELTKESDFTYKTVLANKKLIEEYISNKRVDSESAKNCLIIDLAEVYFVLRCERIHNRIFGSQIKLLEKLSQNPTTALTRSELNEHFFQAAKTHPDFFKNWDGFTYIQFLIQSGLVEYQNNNYFITNFGKDFVEWIYRTGIGDNKLF